MISAMSKPSNMLRLTGKDVTRYWLVLTNISPFLNQNIASLGMFAHTIARAHSPINFRNQVCELMKRIINCVRLHASNQAARNTKADLVRGHAKALLELWAKEVSQIRGANFYMHIAYHHLPGFIERLPVD